MTTLATAYSKGGIAMRLKTMALAGVGLSTLLFASTVFAADSLRHDTAALPALSQTASAYALDDGEELLPLATITIDEAVAAAQTAASGEIGEIDLEYVNNVLVFNVDVGDADVKVDATTGDVVATDYDD
jgi:uncharacterized membrane protein YkoI